MMKLQSILGMLFSGVVCLAAAEPQWEPLGLSGGGGMFSPGISPADPSLMMINCDMSAAYISENGGRDWRMIHHAQLRSDTQCRPAFHPDEPRHYLCLLRRAASDQQRSRPNLQSAGQSVRSSLQGEIAIDPDKPDLLIAGTRSGRCWISEDQGASWQACDGPQGRFLGFHFARHQQGSSDFRRHGTRYLALGRHRQDLGRKRHEACLGKTFKVSPAVQRPAAGRDHPLLHRSQPRSKMALSKAASIAPETGASRGIPRWDRASTPKRKPQTNMPSGP